VLTEWSRASSATPSSYLSGSSPSFTASSPSFTASSASHIPFANTTRDGRILSTITEHTENPTSRPTSYNISNQGSRPNSGAIHNSLPIHSSHARGVTDPGPSGRPQPSTGRRAGDLIAFFEEKTGPEQRATSPFSHSRGSSIPSDARSVSPYTTTLSATASYGYGSGTGSYSRPSSPTKSSLTPSGSSMLSPASRPYTSTSGTPYTNNNNGLTSPTFTTTESSDVTPRRQSSLRRPQAGPRSPLTSVRNIVAAWKDRTPERSAKSTEVDTLPPLPPKDTDDGFFSLRRRAERGVMRARRESGEHEAGPSDPSRRGNAPAYDRNRDLPATPRAANTPTSTNLGLPPPLDLAELGQYAKANQEVSRLFWIH
jgi:hypothetical protein